MFLTVHATAAVLITQKISNPLLAFIIGFVSHYILDALPNGDDKIFERWQGKKQLQVIAAVAGIDFALSLIWLNFLQQQGLILFPLATAAAVIGSMLPDFLNGAFLLTNHPSLRWCQNLNRASHRLILKKPWPTVQGFSSQAVFFIILAIILLKLQATA